MTTEGIAPESVAPGAAGLSAPAEPPTGCGPLRPANAAGAEAAVPLRQALFESVRAHGTMPRVDLARLLSVSPASVTAAANELLAAGFLEEVAATPREGDTLRGRPPVALAVRPGRAFVAGIKLSTPKHTAVIHDFAGTPLAEITRRSASLILTPAEVLAQAEELLDAALAQAGLARGDILKLGVGLPGFIESGSGIALWSPLISAANLPLAAMLSDHLGLDVVIDNDANLVTLAELWFGDGRGVANFAVVTIEYGVGMGLVIDNRLYRGARGLGTELGHTKVQLDGALCRCGQRGCLEAYVADYALVREASTALSLVPNHVPPMQMLESLYREAKAGNAAARSIFRRAGRYLAVGLGNVVNLFDPELILLSGERMRWDYLYADDVLAELQRSSIQVDRPSPRVEIHAWGDMIWARGAAVLAMSQVTSELLGPGAVVAA
ncbi:ROK family transcriptional regulator [Oceaniglobus roseus]|uniref:ROK family transcriptional regulator n=1 Tax=Oceaniglobus roseus TaxID=1737570 RepID=UPI001FE3FE30|nr:ROK family transcriptional regulator [Kandeliimicrobium roseum]